MAQETVKTNYNRYRQNGGSWWTPSGGTALFAGNTSDGTNDYETVLRFDFSAYVPYIWNGMTLYLYRFNDGQSATNTWSMGVEASAGGGIIAGTTTQFSFTQISAWKAVTLSAAQMNALKSGNQYIRFWGGNGEYAGIRPLEYGSGDYAPYVILDYTPYTPCGAPTWAQFDRSLTENSAVLSWGGASDGVNNPIIDYHVYFNVSPDGANWGADQSFAVGSAATSYTFPVNSYALRGQYVRARVYAIGQAGLNSGPSPTTGTVRLNSLPYAVSGASVSVSVVEPGTAIRVSFSAASDPDGNLSGVEAAMQDAGGNWYNGGQIMGSGGAGATYIDVSTAGWSRGGNWRFLVRAYDAFGCRGDWSNPTAYVRINSLPNAMSGASVSVSIAEPGTAIRVSFSAASDPDGNLSGVEAAMQDAGGNWYNGGQIMGSGGAGATFIDVSTAGWGRGGNWRFLVRAYDAFGCRGAWSNPTAYVRINALPSAPSIAFPVAGSTTCNTTPRVGVTVSAEPENQGQRIIALLGGATADTNGDNSSYWSRTGAGFAAGSSLVMRGVAVGTGAQTVVVKGNDGMADGAAASRSFTVAAPGWAESVVAGVTKIKASHISELRTKINQARAYYGLAAASWTDPTLLPGMKIKIAHITEMRSALEQIRDFVNGYDSASGTHDIPAFVWTDPALTQGVTKIKAAHVNELRAAVAAV